MAATRTRRKRKVSIEIRALEPEDAEAVAELFSSPSVVGGTLRLPHRSRAELAEWLRAGPAELHALVAVVDGRVMALGSVHLQSNPRTRHSAEVGLVVHESAQGRGIGGRLLDALLELGVDWLAVLRFSLCVFVDNKAAIKLYRSRGFDIEGVGRGFALRGGELVDVFHMVKLAETLPWPRVTAEEVAQRTPPQLSSGPDTSGNGGGKGKKNSKLWN